MKTNQMNSNLFVQIRVHSWFILFELFGVLNFRHRHLESPETPRCLEPARATSAAVVARLLANVFAARGQTAAADQLHRRAFHIEHGTEPEKALR